MPAGDLGERGLPALRSVFALSRFEKRPKKPGAIEDVFVLFFWKKKYKEKEEEAVEGSHRWRWSMACAYRNNSTRPRHAIGYPGPSYIPRPADKPHQIWRSLSPIRTTQLHTCVHSILPARMASRSECNPRVRRENTRAPQRPAATVSLPYHSNTHIRHPHQGPTAFARFTPPVNAHYCRHPYPSGTARAASSPKLVLQISNGRGSKAAYHHFS
jgi:hypothetical protein